MKHRRMYVVFRGVSLGHDTGIRLEGECSCPPDQNSALHTHSSALGFEAYCCGSCGENIFVDGLTDPGYLYPSGNKVQYLF